MGGETREEAREESGKARRGERGEEREKGKGER